MSENKKICPFLGRLCETVNCGLWSSSQCSCGFLLASEAINLIEETLSIDSINVVVC